MKYINRICAFICTYVISFSSLAQEPQSDILKIVSKDAKIDARFELERRLKRWKKHEIFQILICPQYLKADGDPFSVSGENQLSVRGFGRLEGEDANKFISSINVEDLKMPALTGGHHVELYFLFRDTPFTPADKIVCYLRKDSFEVRVDGGEGNYVWVSLPEKCHELINKNFTLNSYSEKNESGQ